MTKKYTNVLITIAGISLSHLSFAEVTEIDPYNDVYSIVREGDSTIFNLNTFQYRLMWSDLEYYYGNLVANYYELPHQSHTGSFYGINPDGTVSNTIVAAFTDYSNENQLYPNVLPLNSDLGVFQPISPYIGMAFIPDQLVKNTETITRPYSEEFINQVSLPEYLEVSADGTTVSYTPPYLDQNDLTLFNSIGQYEMLYGYSNEKLTEYGYPLSYYYQIDSAPEPQKVVLSEDPYIQATYAKLGAQYAFIQSTYTADSDPFRLMWDELDSYTGSLYGTLNMPNGYTIGSFYGINPDGSLNDSVVAEFTPNSYGSNYFNVNQNLTTLYPDVIGLQFVPSQEIPFTGVLKTSAINFDDLLNEVEYPDLLSLVNGKAEYKPPFVSPQELELFGYSSSLSLSYNFDVSQLYKITDDDLAHLPPEETPEIPEANVDESGILSLFGFAMALMGFTRMRQNAASAI